MNKYEKANLNGPWEIKCHTADGISDITVGDDYTIKDASGGVIAIEGFGKNDLLAKQLQAIIATPDLLSALEDLLIGVITIRGIDMDDYCAKELAAARAAITKAKGYSA